MKKKHLLSFSGLALTALLFSFKLTDNKIEIKEYTPLSSSGCANNGNGDWTGSPISSGTCSTCHSGGSFSPVITVSVLDINSLPITTYIPGNTYTIEYNIIANAGTPGGYGMQAVVISPNAGYNEAGVLSTPGPNTHISSYSGHNYFEQSYTSVTGLFQVQWTAPSSGFGDVNIYAAGIAANGTGGTSGDSNSSTVLSLSECAASAGTDTQVACETFSWMDGNTYTSSTNAPTWALENSTGCDSIVTLNLTINNIDNSVSQNGLSLTAGLAGAQYLWLDCDNNNDAISNETNQVYTADVNGNYAVRITDNGCVDTSACYMITTVGIVENDFGNDFVLYPNPTNGDISIDLGNSYESVTMTISDVNGKVIHTSNHNSQIINHTINEPSGIYLLTIKSIDKKAIIRILKE